MFSGSISFLLFFHHFYYSQKSMAKRKKKTDSSTLVNILFSTFSSSSSQKVVEIGMEGHLMLFYPCIYPSTIYILSRIVQDISNIKLQLLIIRKFVTKKLRRTIIRLSAIKLRNCNLSSIIHQKNHEITTMSFLPFNLHWLIYK